MKYNKFLFFLISLLGMQNQSFSQQKDSCDCFTALAFFSQKIRQAKSYKTLIKTQEKKAFETWKKQIVQEMLLDPELDFYCVAYLQKYISFIKDQHNQIYINSEQIKRNSRPYYEGDLDVLENSLTTVVIDSLEGIYFIGKEKVALVQSDKNTWIGVVLATSLTNWKNGEIHFKIKKQTNGALELFEYYNNGQLVYRKKIELKEGRLYPSFWTKTRDYYWYNNNKSTFDFRVLSDSIDYLSIKTFKRSTALIKEAQQFYDTILPKIVNSYLIIDLRNNGGGSVLQGEPLRKLLTTQKNLKRVYLLVNSLTASAAEIITLQLKKDKKVVLCGETTKGMLAFSYGNKAITLDSKCLGFRANWTVERTKGTNLMQYEYIGISPDLELDVTQNWIKQIQEIINKPN